MKYKGSAIDKETIQPLILREKSSRGPKLYSQRGTPLRPIVSSIGASLEQPAGYLAKQLQPHAEIPESYSKNTSNFFELMEKREIHLGDFFVGFDVHSNHTAMTVSTSDSSSKLGPVIKRIAIAQTYQMMLLWLNVICLRGRKKKSHPAKK